MRTLKDDLLKMNTLHGEELNAHLLKMKALYTKPEEKEAIRKHLDAELNAIENRVDSLDKKHYHQRTNERNNRFSPCIVHCEELFYLTPPLS